MAQALPYPGLQKSAEVAVNRLPGREGGRRRQVAPLAAGAHDVEQAVQEAPHVGRTRPPAGLGRRDQRFEQPILVIAQGLAGTVTANQPAVLGRPHQRPPEREHDPCQQPPPQTLTTDFRNGFLEKAET